ncbi:hypothetical protein DNTS_031815, partial [Danionella cerebrum]
VLLLSPLENLKTYISSRPPLVIFMVSVSAVAIAFLTIGYFFKIKEIKSPEMTEDWNTFLLRFNEIDFCISENETLKHSLNESITPESTVTSSQTRSSTQSPPLLEDPGPINISVAITLTLDPLRPFGGYSRNITHLYASVLGQQVGLGGREAHEEMNITFTLPVAWNSDECVLHGRCEQMVFSTCMTITTASNVFPVTVQPPHCIPETYSNATSWYKIFTTARDSDTKYSQEYNPFWCYKGAIGKVYHTLNPKLTVIVPDSSRADLAKYDRVTQTSVQKRWPCQQVKHLSATSELKHIRKGSVRMTCCLLNPGEVCGEKSSVNEYLCNVGLLQPKTFKCLYLLCK